MKKKVKSLIIAASVAAIAGIGAVSFAKWQASTDVSDVNVAGTATGEIVTIGSFTATGDLETGEVLMPWDQEDQLTDKTKKSWTITIDDANLETDLYDFTYSVKYNAQTDKDLGADKLYVFTGATYAAPASTNIKSDTVTGDAALWVPLGNTAVEIKSGKKIYVVLVSDSATNDSKKNFGVTISATASEKTASESSGS